jgi:hypothetical protein
MTPAELAAIRAWARELDTRWVLVPARTQVARTRHVSGYAEKQKIGETLLRLCDEVEALREQFAQLTEDPLRAGRGRGPR